MILISSHALHLTKQFKSSNYGEEAPEVSNKCTKVCGDDFSGKSCSKTVLARVYIHERPDMAIKAYVILDDQSNKSLAGSELFSLLHLNGSPSEYHLTSCAGTVNTYG